MQVINRDKVRTTALLLAVLTIVYNLAEGMVATYYGASDETLALFGFGVDSFVEVLSGLGITHMIMRMKKQPVGEMDRFERRALRITGTAFYLLVAGLLLGSILAVLYEVRPVTTVPGIILSVVSILSMYILYRQKLKAGRQLNSQPIISDAHCTKTCFYLSFILLGSSLLYAFFRIPYVDALGSLGIAWYAFGEGREAIEKASHKRIASEDDCC